VDRIDPIAETQRYVDKIMATKGAGLNAQERALMLEDLRRRAPKRWRCSMPSLAW
jgi:arsenite-transporting ATPase